MDKKYTTQHYPKLREICFRLLEKTDLLDIFHNFIIYFKSIFNAEKYTHVISRCAHYQSLDKIPNKQIWLLESWFLDCILIYYNLYDSNKDIYDSSSYTLMFGTTIFSIFLTFLVGVFFVYKYFTLPTKTATVAVPQDVNYSYKY